MNIVHLLMAINVSVILALFALIIYMLRHRRISRELIEELYVQAITDGLTKLFNHRFFHQRLEEEVERVRRYGYPVTLLMMDLDNFKDFNDTYGHQWGDHVLSSVGEVIQQGTRRVDFSARYGGEEFAIILPHTNLGGAQVLAERLREGVAKLIIKPGTRMRIQMSIGVATYDGKDKTFTAEQLLRQADEALYRAKHSGRNQVAMYDGAITKAEG